MSRGGWIAASVLAIGGGTAAVLALTATGPFAAAKQTPTPTPSAVVPKTTEVISTDLVETLEMTGTLAYPEPMEVVGRKPGTLTSVREVGTTVRRGEALFRIDDDPIVLLYGSLPAYRTLKDGDEGRDVEQLEQNLRELGYDGFTVDDEYTSYTAEAVEEWQEDLGIEETGVVELGRVVFAPGAIRIAESELKKGSVVGGGQPVLSYGNAKREVTAELEVADQELAKVGAKVEVELPSGETVEGKIEEIGRTATAEQSDQQGGQETEDASLAVRISIADQKALGGLDQAPVTVELVADRRDGVLAVPVDALLALREGGYGVELVEGSRTEVVPVELGLFADGFVEVRSERLSEGRRVGVASD